MNLFGVDAGIVLKSNAKIDDVSEISAFLKQPLSLNAQNWPYFENCPSTALLESQTNSCRYGNKEGYMQNAAVRISPKCTLYKCLDLQILLEI